MILVHLCCVPNIRYGDHLYKLCDLWDPARINPQRSTYCPLSIITRNQHYAGLVKPALWIHYYLGGADFTYIYIYYCVYRYNYTYIDHHSQDI